ncbi:MAG: TRAP transporter substrate-binding protein DctP, partial [Bacteroidota bacterium]
PFGMNAQQVSSWVAVGGGMELWEELYADYGLVPLLGGDTGVQMGGWFNREINTIDDFKGLKMRIPGLGGKVLEKVGGAPVLLAGGEIYTGLERGVIDATEWLGPFHDSLMGFDEIAKYYYSPGWHEPGTVLEYTINKKVWDELTPDLQAILRSASMHVHSWVLWQMESRNAAVLQEFIKKGVDLRTFSPEIMDTLRTINEDVVNDLANSDPFAKRVYASYDDFRKKAAVYAGFTEEVFFERIQG